MIVLRRPLSRRTMLRGFGTVMALPLLEAMAPAARAAETKVMRRFQAIYTPNGVIMPNFVPKTTGEGYELSEILKPLAAFRDRFTVISGVANSQPPPPGGGGGGHGSACGLWLTGVYPKPTQGFDISCGVSIDQVIAQQIGKDSPIGSLELGIEPPSLTGTCDQGFSCAYTNTVSWRTPTSPLPTTVNPRELFERLFGDGDTFDSEARAAQIRHQGSLLDFVMEDFGRLSGKVGVADKRKIDEYLDAVRDVERRVQVASEQTGPVPDVSRPAGIPASFMDHAKLMIDLQVIAMQADLTRVGTLMFGREASYRTYPEIGVDDAHHYLSHHGNEPAKLAGTTKINVMHMEMFAYYLQRMAETKEGERSLLDNTLVLQGASMGDPNSHDRQNFSFVTVNLAKGGRHIAVPKGTPASNLLVSALHTMGVEKDQFGASTGPLKELAA
jgi:hypothetical protein